VLAAVLVGGTAISGGSGGVIRTVIGALIVTVLRNGMNVIGLNIYYQQLVLGSILILAVMLTTDRAKLASIK
jgi:ribose transport system permease protein